MSSASDGSGWQHASRWVMLLLVGSVVTWRSRAVFDGGVDVVVLAKAVLGLLALALAWVSRISVPRTQPMGNAAVWVVLFYITISTFGAWTDGGLRVSGILSVRLLLVTLTLVLLVKTFPRQVVLDDLLACFTVIGLAAAATGIPTLLATGRLHGGIPEMHSNELSLLLTMPILRLLHQLMLGQARTKHLLLLALLGGALLATGSRTAALTATLAGMIMIAQARRLGRVLTVALLAAPPLVLAVAVRTEALRNFFLREGAGEGDITTLNSRSIVWEAALDHAETWWTRWMGSGLAIKRIPVEGQYWSDQNLDSSWFSALVQAGYLGLFLLVVLVLIAVAATIVTPWPERPLLQAMLVALLLRSILESGLIDSSPGFLTFLAITLLAGRHGWSSRDGLPLRRSGSRPATDADPRAGRALTRPR